MYISNKSISFKLNGDYNLSVSELRFAFEYFILHALCYVISEQLNAIIRAIDNKICMEKNKQSGEQFRGFARPPDDCINQYKVWMTAYKNVRDSASICNTILSFEVVTFLL